MRAADERHVLRVRQLDVRHELAAAVQMARILLAQERGADAEGGLGRGVHLLPGAFTAAAAAMAATMLV